MPHGLCCAKVLCKESIIKSTSFRKMLWHLARLARSGTAQGLLKSKASHHRCNAMWSSSLAAALQLEYVSHGHTEPRMHLRCQMAVITRITGIDMDIVMDSYGYSYR